jgi:acetyl esterase/lipase
VSRVSAEDGIVFGEATLADGTSAELALDIYTPAGDTETSRPAVILVHGGGFTAGERDGGHVMRWVDALGRLGYVVVSIDYRLDPSLAEAFFAGDGAESPRLAAQLNGATVDARQAVRFLTDHAAEYGIDAERVGSLGFSAGGTVALALAHRQSAVLEGDAGPAVDAVVAVAAAMPASWAAAGAPPVLMAHGLDDDTIPYAWGERTCGAIVQMGSECTFYPLEGEHGIPDDQYELLDPVVVDFLAENVAGV